MREIVILDTGPLVAWLSARDAWHKWATEEFGRLEPPFVTCESVLSEACFIYLREGGEPARVLAKVRSGLIQPSFAVADEVGALEVLMRRYADKPMSLADACLVRLSELHKDCRVFTLDRHFKHYRRFGRSIIPLLSPW
ncbi:MAG: PIN domain-containing protein [Verrucomicrobiota bacterium]|nr:PIN domain-containing protein [Verrucomicrobiota bacterium]